jgi:hypothetical protein
MANGNLCRKKLQPKKLATWLAEFSLSLSLLYTLLFVASSLNEGFYVLTQRSMVPYTVEFGLFSPALDAWVWGVAVVLVSGWLGWNLLKNRTDRRIRSSLIFVPLVLVVLASIGLSGYALALASLAVTILVFVFSVDCFGLCRFWLARNVAVGAVAVGLFAEVAALVLFNLPILFKLPPIAPGIASYWNMVGLSLSNVAFGVLPYGYLLLIFLGIGAFVGLVLPVGRWVEKGRSKGVFRFIWRLRASAESVKDAAKSPFSSRFPLAAAVAVSVFVSCALVVVTVLPWINPTFRLVSVDAPGYYHLISNLRGLDFNSAMSLAFTNDRALFLIFSYALSYVVSPLNLVQFLPALLIPLFCVVSLLVMRLFCSLRDALVFSVLLVPLSFQALGLIYSGYFANMFAVILVFAYFFLFVRVSRSWSVLGVFAMLLVSVGILFSHSWTWFIFAISLGAFLLLEWRSADANRGSFKTKATIVATTIVVGFVCDLARNLLSAGSSSVSVAGTVSTSLGLPNLAFLFGGVRETVNFFLGGVFANQVLLFLFLVGFLFMLTFKSSATRLLASWVFVGCVSMLFASGEFVFNRFLFLMPSAIFGGLGLAYLVRVSSGGFQGSKTKKLVVELLIVGFVFATLLVTSLRYVSNLNLL